MTDSSQTGVRVTAKFFFLFWILYFIKPHIVVDGADSATKWNTPTFVPTSPGQHTVEVYFPYFIPRKAGKGSITVNVAAGQVVEIGYKAPWVVFFKGKMTQG
ncbi:MAG: hypothetical protein Q7V57_14060 [Actinomycetota bacterium]|nr:hypothetical protein [Actinomycetota bacterium]